MPLFLRDGSPVSGSTTKPRRTGWRGVRGRAVASASPKAQGPRPRGPGGLGLAGRAADVQSSTTRHAKTMGGAAPLGVLLPAAEETRGATQRGESSRERREQMRAEAGTGARNAGLRGTSHAKTSKAEPRRTAGAALRCAALRCVRLGAARAAVWTGRRGGEANIEGRPRAGMGFLGVRQNGLLLRGLPDRTELRAIGGRVGSDGCRQHNGMAGHGKAWPGMGWDGQLTADGRTAPQAGSAAARPRSHWNVQAYGTEPCGSGQVLSCPLTLNK